MHIVDYFVIAGYFALVMYLGYYSMKKVSNTPNTLRLIPTKFRR